MQLRRYAAVSGREAGETAPCKLLTLCDLHITIEAPAEQAKLSPDLFTTSSGVQSWSVIRGKGKTIPSEGTLVIGREQVSPSPVLCWLEDLQLVACSAA